MELRDELGLVVPQSWLTIVGLAGALDDALFVVSCYNLSAVILCHGFYDTAAFLRLARKTSKYSDLDAKTRSDDNSDEMAA